MINVLDIQNIEKCGGVGRHVSLFLAGVSDTAAARAAEETLAGMRSGLHLICDTPVAPSEITANRLPSYALAHAELLHHRRPLDCLIICMVVGAPQSLVIIISLAHRHDP